MDSKALATCEVCGDAASERIRGCCAPCYERWSATRSVGTGAICRVCGERRRENLRYLEIGGRSQTLCYGCAARALKITPMPLSLAPLRAELAKERRQGDRRTFKL